MRTLIKVRILQMANGFYVGTPLMKCMMQEMQQHVPKQTS